jgi:uncharacterized protein (DUF2252 family)
LRLVGASATQRNRQHLTVADRVAAGKAARHVAPRCCHAGFEPAPGRRGPLDVLADQASTRVAELVPIRYGRMALSPFAFFRGAAAIMAQDLTTTPRSGLDVQCCGDAHAANFGLFASPERRLVFDINDFDETLPGPWEWDVKRLAASVWLAAEDNEFHLRDQRAAVLAAVTEYRRAMRRFAAMSNLGVWYLHLQIEPLLEEKAREARRGTYRVTEKLVAKARTRDSMSALSKLTQEVAGEIRIADQSPLIVPADLLAAETGGEDLLDQLRTLLERYGETLDFDRRALLGEFELADFARKVVGVGSVGTRAWIALLFGRDREDPLFLQVKEAQASVLEDVLTPSQFSNHGQRVVVGQRRMQAVSDIFLGWVRVESPLDGESRDFYGRQLRDWKASMDIGRMLPRALRIYGRLCGWTLARAHARTGDRVAIASYLGSGPTFDRAILEFAEAYAIQNDRDYRTLVDAIRSGDIEARVGL